MKLLLTLWWRDFLCVLFGHRWALLEQSDWERSMYVKKERTRRDRCVCCGEIKIHVEGEGWSGYRYSYSVSSDSGDTIAVTMET